ncbi:ATP-binding protein [Arthrobacter cryoconiti]|uniref:AAA family ATPase n=1 Tax=Arthrobacter cryoconiti TaxID=748907 RepID=A0ABV8R5G5_9MICC|nr:ATP-binding protein [Arthrobacter cryoconiti]MCC9066744.1 AAA family ATPase [Arthrobacter cryoconiti]
MAEEAYALARLIAPDPTDTDYWVAVYQNGLYTYVPKANLENPIEGILVLIGQQGGQIFAAPPNMTWGNDWVTLGTIRHIGESHVIVEIGSQLRAFPLPETDVWEIAEGDVVQILDETGIGVVLAGEKDLSGNKGETDGRRFERQPPEGNLPPFIGETVSDAIERYVELPIRRKTEYATIGVSPAKGVLFVGPPGTGKTMVARQIAKRVDASFFVVDGPEIMSRYVGDAELALRNIFREASSRERAIIFFDEIDTIAPSRDKETHESGVRLVGMLLTLMDGFNSSSNVMVIGATNRVNTLDTALRRNGRFQAEVNFSLPLLTERRQILDSVRATLQVRDDAKTTRIEQETAGWSGADLADIWQQAGWNAAGDQRLSIAQEDLNRAFEQVQQQRLNRERTTQ